jgi:hypothetical protein
MRCPFQELPHGFLVQTNLQRRHYASFRLYPRPNSRERGAYFFVHTLILAETFSFRRVLLTCTTLKE